MGIAIIVPSVSFKSKGLGKVTILEDLSIKDISSIEIEKTDTNSYSITAILNPINTTENELEWTFEDGSKIIPNIAELVSSGENSATLNVLRGASSSNVTIKVTSKAKSELSKSKAINVSYEFVLNVEWTPLNIWSGRGVGTEIVNTTTSTIYSRTNKIECSEGDVFTLHGAFAGASVFYAFLDNENKIIEEQTSQTTITDVVVTAPTNSRYLIANMYENYPHQVKAGNVQWEFVREQITLKPGLVSASNLSSVVSSVGNNSTFVTIGIVPCLPNDKFKITGTGGSGSSRLWGFVGNDLKPKVLAEPSEVATDKIITAPSDAAFVIFTASSTAPYSFEYVPN